MLVDAVIESAVRFNLTTHMDTSSLTSLIFFGTYKGMPYTYLLYFLDFIRECPVGVQAFFFFSGSYKGVP